MFRPGPVTAFICRRFDLAAATVQAGSAQTAYLAVGLPGPAALADRLGAAVGLIAALVVGPTVARIAAARIDSDGSCCRSALSLLFLVWCFRATKAECCS